MKKTLAIIGACVICIPCLLLLGIVFALVPLPYVLLSLGLFAGAFIWWKMRGRSRLAGGSEFSLIGRQTTKDGLL